MSCEVAGLLCWILGIGMGWLLALVQVARDPQMHRVDDTKVILSKKDFERLQLIAKIKNKTPDLMFDKEGHLQHELGGDKDEA